MRKTSWAEAEVNNERSALCHRRQTRTEKKRFFEVVERGRRESWWRKDIGEGREIGIRAGKFGVKVFFIFFSRRLDGSGVDPSDFEAE